MRWVWEFMLRAMRVLALDVGSSSVKAGYWDGVKIASRARAEFKTRFEGARVEIAQRDVLRAVERAGVEVMKGQGKGVEAVAFCTFSPGVVVTDGKGGEVVPVITHADRRSSAVALELVKRRPKGWWLTRTGNLPYAGSIGSSTLAWLADEERNIFRRGNRVGQVSSLVGHFLTGRWLIDRSQGAFLGLWDIRRDKWSEEVCKVVGVPTEALPELHFGDEVIGGLTGTLARKWGLAEGVPVVGGFVDTSAAVIQTPMRGGQLAHNAGSTDVLAMCVGRAHPAEGILSRPVGVSATWVGRKEMPWLAVRTIASAGSAMAWVKGVLFAGISEEGWGKMAGKICRDLEKEAAEVKCVPTFVGERAAMVQPQGAEFSGVRLDTDKEDILRSVVRGLVVESAKNHGMLSGIHKAEKRVFAMGGASALGDAMHRAWKGRHVFERLEGEGMSGLVLLAERTMGRAKGGGNLEEYILVNLKMGDPGRGK
jgi:sugar (pentulose or hexulose) kinase